MEKLSINIIFIEGKHSIYEDLRVSQMPINSIIGHCETHELKFMCSV